MWTSKISTKNANNPCYTSAQLEPLSHEEEAVQRKFGASMMQDLIEEPPYQVNQPQRIKLPEIIVNTPIGPLAALLDTAVR